MSDSLGVRPGALSLIRRAFALAWAASKRLTVGLMVAQVVAAVVGALELVVIGGLLAKLTRKGQVISFAQSRGLLIAFGVVLAVRTSLTVLIAELRGLMSERISRHAFGRLIDVAATQDLVEFENPAFHDQLERARRQTENGAWTMMWSLVTLLGAVVSTVAAGVVLALAAPGLLPVLVLGFIPLFVAQRRNNRDLYSFAYERSADDRERRYLGNLLTGKDAAKEVRVFGSVPTLRDRYDRLWDVRLHELRLVVRRRIVRLIATNALTSLVVVAAAATLVWLAARGSISVARAGVAVLAVQQVTGRLRAGADGVSELHNASLFLADYQSFVARLPEPVARSGSADVPNLSELRVDGLSFRYPDAERDALADVTLTIEAGQVVALVGENGSGKTTLAKLLCGLYHPTTGTIRWNGTDITSFDRDDLWAHIAVIFQDFIRYQLPARQNIVLGSAAHSGEEDRLREAADRAGIGDTLRALPDGFDTRLGREYEGGVDLSGGQWQRVALARAFFRDSEFLVLDEPTASLDPRAEAAFFSRVAELAHGRTVLLITHRLTSIGAADRILVMDQGRIIEDGTHASLVAADGLYNELFELQSKRPG
jgi:ATP-binding cassette subfamily B protein